MTAKPPATDHRAAAPPAAAEAASLVSQLAAQLRTVASDLPLPHVLRAAQCLRTASGLLTYVLQASAHPSALPRLAAAEEHLGQAARAMWAARDAIEQYLTSIGVAGVGTGPAPPPRPEAAEQQQSAPAPHAVPVDSVSGLTDWWATRVNELTDHGDGTPVVRQPAAEPPGNAAPDPEATLRELTRLAQAEDRDGYRDALVDTSPAAGLRLPALGVPVLRGLATERLGRRPTAADLDDLRATAVPRVRALLPRLDEQLPVALLAEVCHAYRHPAAARAEPPHPVDVAVAYPPLVAAFLSAVGRGDDHLAERLAEAGAPPQPAPDAAGAPRPA